MNKVLVYHTITTPGDAMPGEIDFSPEGFESHLSWLAGRRGRVVPLKTLLGAPEEGNFLAITIDEGLRSSIEGALPILERYELPMTLFVTAGYIGERGYLSADELKELAAHPLVTIGSHGLWHRPLTLLRDDETRYELAESRKHLEGVAGRRIDLFAYPYGDCDRRVAELCSRAGYKAAWSVWNRFNTPFTRWRVPLSTGDHVGRLVAKLSPLYFPIKRLVKPPRVETVHENFVLQSYRQSQWS